MGSRFQVYAGPYLRCLNPTVSASKHVRTCPNAHCELHGPWADHHRHFCGNCGTQFSLVPVPTKQQTVDSWSLYDTLKERLRPANTEYLEPGIDLWALNKTSDFGRNLYLSDDTGEHPVNPDRELAVFKAGYSQEIAAVVAAYGRDNVTVLWGLIGEYR